MDAVDSYIPVPEREMDKPFLLAIEDVFSITGRGTVVTGKIERGTVILGDLVEIVGFYDCKSTTVTGIEMFQKTLPKGIAGDNVGILLRGISVKEVIRGMVLAQPGSIVARNKFEAEVYILKKEEGGRHTLINVGYRPQFYVRTTDVTGQITNIISETTTAMPGDKINISVDLISAIALEKQMRFAIREGGKTVGSGVIINVQ